MPCALAAVVFGIPKVQSCHQASKRTRPEKAGIEPSLENGENPPAISSRMPAVNSRRADNCSILGIPFCAKIVLHPVDVPGTNCNVPQGLSHCSGRHWCIQRHQKQCRPHLVGNIVFRHTTAFFFCRRPAVNFLFFSYEKRQSIQPETEQ